MAVASLHDHVSIATATFIAICSKPTELLKKTFSFLLWIPGYSLARCSI